MDVPPPETDADRAVGPGAAAGVEGAPAGARAGIERADLGPGQASYDTDRVWTLPNILSLLRLAGVPLMLWLIVVPEADLLAVGVLAVAGFTDWLDGYLARTWHQRSRLGQMLDPIADRFYILAALIGLAIRDLIPWWLLVVLVLRDVVITVIVPVLKTRGYSSLPVHFLGKAATFCLLYAFPLILLGAAPTPVALVARVAGWAFAIWGTYLYWYAGWLYLVQTRRLLKTLPPIVRPR